MKKIIVFLTIIGLMGLMTSCVEEVIDTEGVQEGQVAFIISDFKSSEQTKSAFQLNGSELKFQWSADDAIGIFPEEGWQTEFSMEEGAGTSVAIFDGGSWGLKRESVYYAYYPFSKENFGSKDMRERVKYSYEGQEAAFADGEGVVDLSDYDFMASGRSAVENGSVSFRFGHLGALCRVRLGVPATASYSYFVLESGDEKFSMSGYYDATDKKGEGISLVADSEAGTQFKVLFPAECQDFAEGDKAEFYFLMPPVDLTGQVLTFVLVDDQGNDYDFSIEPKNIVAGMTYSWDVNYTEDENPSSAETANCYIVSEAGTYSFPTVKGNGSESVGAVATAEVLWESFGTATVPEVGDLVSAVSYSNGHISYTVPSPFKEGNAVIAAKDESGKILWSWHIWLTDKPEDQVYRNNAGTMMDRNLGATSATPGDVEAWGLLYQWGRKDPFMGAAEVGHNPETAASTLEPWPDYVTADATTGTIEYVIENPTVLILGDMDWLYFSVSGMTENDRWGSSKTIYDPCPVGYHVPEADFWAATLSNVACDQLWDSDHNGFNLNSYIEGSGTCWYPAAGCINSYDDVSFFNAGWDVCLWTSTPSSLAAKNIYMATSVTNPMDYSTDRDCCLSVRCYKETSATVPEPDPVAATNLSAAGTANSYIVSAEGAYEFSTVQGNSSVSVGEVADVEVLWESFGTDVTPNVGALISYVAYADNAITFKASDKKGNAVIAAKDSEGTVLWSWHIWMTDEPEDQVYRNYVGTMMDRNLGATSATPGDVGTLGLFYQWGRKDPFLGSSSISESVVAKSTLASWPSAEASTESVGTIAYAVANPTTFITQNLNNYDWYFSSEYVNDDTRWQSVKTVYDPCPVGYRVPDGGRNGVWYKAFGNQDSFNDETAYDSTNRGFNFIEGSMTDYFLSDEETCWYPSAGFLYKDYGSLSNMGYVGHYWSCTPLSGFVCDFSFSYNGSINLSGGDHRAYGKSVRCYKENSATEPIAATNLSAKGTANSYIVSKEGTYKFSTVRGNSSVSVGKVAYAEVLWESYGTDVAPEVGALISEATYSNSAIFFKASNEKGNAVIAAKDAEGTILWSWHVWLTDKPADQVYNNYVGTMMDRNLGATSATPGDVGTLGLLYQWGRKDPFLGSSSISSTTAAASTLNSWPSAVTSDASTGTLSYVMEHPTTFIGQNGSNYDWYYTGDDTTDDTRWQSSKTIYDPCPVGYRVPDGGETGVWATAFGKAETFEGVYDSVNKGFNFGSSAETDNLTNSSDVCWYPAASSYLYFEDGSLASSVSSYFWSCTQDGFYAYNLYLKGGGSVKPLNGSRRAVGESVRCYKENSAMGPAAATNLSAAGTANSYIVSAEGAYEFSTVQGNSSVSVGEVADVEVLWETYGTDETPKMGALIPYITYADNVITFKASDKKGNAVIAAKDAEGTILWSWHIWMTDKPADQVYRNNAGTMMDRNLGATSAEPGSVGALGLLYQWGRKDPFLGSFSISSSTVVASTLNSWPSAVTSDASTGTLSYAMEHPTTFIGCNESNEDWYYTGDDTTDDTRWQSSKTIYDPCPAGYRVPTGGSNGVWYKAFGKIYYFTDETYDSTNKGFNFTEGSMVNYYLTDEETCWYPAAGARYSEDNMVYYTGSYGNYWSCTPEGYSACYLNFTYDGSAFFTANSSSRKNGYSVRCQKIE